MSADSIGAMADEQDMRDQPDRHHQPDRRDRPELRVVRGAPTPEELAAIVGVLWSRRATAGAAPAPTEPVSRWRASARPGAGQFLRPGPGAWSASAR